jgi:hypothetical protein
LLGRWWPRWLLLWVLRKLLLMRRPRRDPLLFEKGHLRLELPAPVDSLFQGCLEPLLAQLGPPA